MSEWPMVKLGEVARVVAGGTPKTSVLEYWDGDIPWVTPKDLALSESLWINAGERFITDYGLAKSAAALLPRGTVLWSSRAPIGLVAIANNQIATNQGFKSFVPGEELDSEYLAYFLIHQRPILEMMGVGATFKEVSAKRAAEIMVPLPPLGEQKRIAEILGGVSKAIQILEHELQLLGEISVLEQQNNLSTQKLSDLVTIRSGTVDPTLSVNRNLPHIAPDSIEKNTGRILQIRSCKEDKVTSGKYHFYKGDVLYSKIRPYLNKVVIAPFEGLCSADMYALRPKEGINSEVLQALLMSKDFLAYADQWSGRASIPKINRKTLLAYNVPKMTDSQVNEAKVKIQSIHKVVELKCRKLSLLQELQKSLANRAFAGLL